MPPKHVIRPLNEFSAHVDVYAPVDAGRVADLMTKVSVNELYSVYHVADKTMTLGLDVREYLPFCDVLVPTVHNKCFSCIFASDIIFMNRAVCEDVRKSVFQYYTDHFDSICEKDTFVANVFVNVTINENHTPFNMSCQSHGNYFLRSTGTGIMNTWQDIIILIFFVAVGLFVFPLL